jgi:hypothetical protein
MRRQPESITQACARLALNADFRAVTEALEADITDAWRSAVSAKQPDLQVEAGLRLQALLDLRDQVAAWAKDRI